MLGISHKILRLRVCIVRMYSCLVLSSFNEIFNKKNGVIVCVHRTPTQPEIAPRLIFRQSVLRVFFSLSLRKLILDMYIWAIAY